MRCAAQLRLMLMKAGDAARRDPAVLWSHLAARVVPGERDRFAHEAGLLVLLHAASGDGHAIPIDRIARMLGELGWRRGDGTPLQGYDLWHVRGNVFALLDNIGEAREEGRRRSRAVGPVAAALARAAPLASPPG